MKSKLMFFARLSRKRARTQARRLNVLMKQYRSDPVRNFCTHSCNDLHCITLRPAFSGFFDQN